MLDVSRYLGGIGRKYLRLTWRWMTCASLSTLSSTLLFRNRINSRILSLTILVNTAWAGISSLYRMSVSLSSVRKIKAFSSEHVFLNGPDFATRKNASGQRATCTLSLTTLFFYQKTLRMAFVRVNGIWFAKKVKFKIVLNGRVTLRKFELGHKDKQKWQWATRKCF